MDYDVAIVGGGHNALVAAAYLARAGRSVCVLERLDHVGGAAVSGGIGTVIGSIVGGLVMAFLNNGLQLIGAGADPGGPGDGVDAHRREPGGPD